MENEVLTINKVKEDFLNFLWDVFCTNHDDEIFNFSFDIEREFENLKGIVATQKKDELSTSVKTITNYIELLVEKLKHLYFSLKLSYLKEKFDICVKYIMSGAQAAN